MSSSAGQGDREATGDGGVVDDEGRVRPDGGSLGQLGDPGEEPGGKGGPGDGRCVNVRLEGQIKEASVTMSRDIRVGIEFIRLSETEQAITAVLSVMSDILVGT